MRLAAARFLVQAVRQDLQIKLGTSRHDDEHVHQHMPLAKDIDPAIAANANIDFATLAYRKASTADPAAYFDHSLHRMTPGTLGSFSCGGRTHLDWKPSCGSHSSSSSGAHGHDSAASESDAAVRTPRRSKRSAHVQGGSRKSKRADSKRDVSTCSKLSQPSSAGKCRKESGVHFCGAFASSRTRPTLQYV